MEEDRSLSGSDPTTDVAVVQDVFSNSGRADDLYRVVNMQMEDLFGRNIVRESA